MCVTFYQNLDSTLKQREEAGLPTLWVHHFDMKPDSDLLKRLKDYHVEIGHNRSDQWLIRLLLKDSVREIERLNKQIADMEKAFLLSKTHHD